MSINLQAFCNSGHEKLNSPFTVGGFTYAANGHVLVRVAAVKDFGGEAPEGFFDLPFDHENLTDWQKFPEVEVERGVCGECKGTGYTAGCKECGGVGEIEYWSGYHYYYFDCLSCNGAGVVTSQSDKDGSNVCDCCRGTGQFVKHKAVDVGRKESGIADYYIELIKKECPGAVFSPFGEGRGSVFRFKFEGGVGLVMSRLLGG